MLLNAVSQLPEIVRKGCHVSTMPDNRGRHNVKAVHAFEAEISVGGGDTVTVWSHAREAPVRYFYDLTGDVGAGASIRTEGNSQREMVPALEGNADRKNLVQVAGENQCRARWLGRSRRGGATPSPAEFRIITKDVNDEIAASGLAGKVKAKVVRALYSRATGQKVEGRFMPGTGEIAIGPVTV